MDCHGLCVFGGERARWELAALLNPIHHGATATEIATYKVEPYVIAADVYAVAPHTGRGGWTWYTGSAGWMYRLLTETLLGLNLEGNRLRLNPVFRNTGRAAKFIIAIGKPLITSLSRDFPTVRLTQVEHTLMEKSWPKKPSLWRTISTSIVSRCYCRTRRHRLLPPRGERIGGSAYRRNGAWGNKNSFSTWL
jgi:Glycosyl hydrolase 36 superfamily, catalytic domain